MRKQLRIPIFELLLALVAVTQLHAQAPAGVPADASPGTAQPAQDSQAPEAMTKKITDLVDAGKYADAQQLVAGLLIAYPNDQRLLKAKTLINQLLSPGPGAAPAPSTNQPAAQPAPSEAVPLSGMDKVDYNALIELAREAQEATDLEEQKKLLLQFIRDSITFFRKYEEFKTTSDLAIRQRNSTDPDEKLRLSRQWQDEVALIGRRHPEQILLWQLRAAAAISLNQPLNGYDAWRWLVSLGAADSSDPSVQSVLGQLKNKGWTDPKAAASAQVVAQRQQAAEKFRGFWFGAVAAQNANSPMKGCTEAELKSNKCLFHDFIDKDQKAIKFEFEIDDDGTIVISDHVSFAGCEGKVYGVAQGAEMKDIVWQVRPASGPPHQIYSTYGPEAFGFSCNRPFGEAVFTSRYNFVTWQRSTLVPGIPTE